MGYTKLSDAIEAGSTRYPQIQGAYCRVSADGYGTCAIGAAYVALYDQLPIGAQQTGAVCRDVSAALGTDIMDEALTLPIPPGLNVHLFDDNQNYLASVVTGLNDGLGWSYQQIIDYLRQYGY